MELIQLYLLHNLHKIEILINLNLNMKDFHDNSLKVDLIFTDLQNYLYFYLDCLIFLKEIPENWHHFQPN